MESEAFGLGGDSNGCMGMGDDNRSKRPGKGGVMHGKKIHDPNRSLRYLILSADLAWIVTCLSAIQALDASSVRPQQILTFHLYESMTVLTCAMWIVLYFGKRL